MDQTGVSVYATNGYVYRTTGYVYYRKFCMHLDTSHDCDTNA